MDKERCNTLTLWGHQKEENGQSFKGGVWKRARGEVWNMDVVPMPSEGLADWLDGWLADWLAEEDVKGEGI